MMFPFRVYGRASWLALLLVLLALGAFASSASAAVGWAVDARAYPTNISPGGSSLVEVEIFPLGKERPQGIITVTDTLPPGLKAEDAGGFLAGFGGENPDGYIEHEDTTCYGATVVTCTVDPSRVRFTPPAIRLGILIHADLGLSGTVSSQVTVAGGGALSIASTIEPITASTSSAAFGFNAWDAILSNADGTIDTRAGSHPYEAIFNLELNDVFPPGSAPKPAAGELRDLTVNLPPGLIGDPGATAQCTTAQLNASNCPIASQIGFEIPFTGGLWFELQPVYNMVPPPGVPAEFAFLGFGISTRIDSGPRTGGDYGITSRISDVVEKRGVTGDMLTLWGVPADPSHDRQRGHCLQVNNGANGEGEVSCPVAAALKPFLTMPTQCAGPQTFSIEGNTWSNGSVTGGASFLSHDSNDNPTGITGCEPLHFEPDITLAPDTSFADTPAGLTAEVSPSVGGLLEPEGLSTSDVQNTKVVLPAGVAINPGQAAGLVACQAGEDAVGTEEPAHCPAASKVGTVAITTPLLPDKLEGNVYVLQSNPPNLELLVAASADGVNLKLVGKVHLDEATGQLTTTFSGTPELPFTNFKLAFSGGAQAALDTPTQCGTYSASADFTPWSSPFVADVSLTSGFAVSEGPGGGPCPSNPLPFSPSLTAGSTTDQAGGFTSFSLLLQRGDGQQRIEKLQFKAPPGLSGMISTVPLCQEPQAAQGTCPASSQIGHATVTSGPGPYPLVVPAPGRPPAAIYLTGPYQGAPFGLSIVTHVLAGPFDLGTIVTRGRIEIDPATAQITVTTDPLPQVVDGVPTDLRLVDSVIDRPGFMFNPTDCNEFSFAGTARGTPPPGVGGPGASAPLSSRFQVGNCASLKFKPSFTVSTSGRTSRRNGASLHVSVTYPKGSFGSQANIARVKVALPRQMPSRLTTLQKACPAQTFAANPAACPPASVVGHAIVHTQLLPVALEGPAYFVSHGGEAFPNLIIVLQGYGVTIELVGDTFIKNGVTSSTFAATPDVPFESFELTLPEGPYSALAANGDLCRQKLVMPTAFTAQNGATLKQDTRIETTGCPGSLSVLSKRVNKRSVKIGVYVPAAGRLTISGRGVSSAGKSATGPEALSLTLNQQGPGKLTTRLKVAFTPSKGRKQTRTVAVRFSG